MHFLKVLGLVQSKDDLGKVFDALSDLLKFPLQDTLNIRNGLSYSQVIEAILRVAFMRLEDSEYVNQDNGFRMTLEQIF